MDVGGWVMMMMLRRAWKDEIAWDTYILDPLRVWIHLER